MTTYEIPTAPDVDTVWLTPPDATPVERWTRVGANTWKSETAILTWSELLQLGKAWDVHPDLPADAPLPWRVDFEAGVVDANKDMVRLGLRLGPFVVKAVNAYGERVTGGDVSPVDALTATLQAELAEVLGEVDALLAGRIDDARRAEAALRARLDRA